MIFRGLLERSLGGFTCIRGYAKLSDLAKVSKPNEQYQRDLVPEHKKDLEAYLDAGESVFFPEVILSYTLNPEYDNFTIVGSSELLSTSSSVGKMVSLNQFNKTYASTKDSRQTDLIRLVTLNVDDIYLAMGGPHLFNRIDGNHRLTAAEEVDPYHSDILAPFCIILLNQNDTDAKHQSIIFHNINSKGLALTSEENLKAIFENNSFSDDELERSFDWVYLKARQLIPEIDKDYLNDIHHVFENGMRHSFVCGLKFLKEHGHLTKKTSLKSIKENLGSVNAIYKGEPRLKACKELGLLTAFLYYSFKGASEEKALAIAFKNWVLRNHIDEIKSIDTQSIVDVFNKVHASQIKIFMAMPFYSKGVVNDYNKALKNAVDSIVAANPHINLENFPIMKSKSPTVDIITDVMSKIKSCDIFIADITDNNANVLYEYGFAKGQFKPCILLKDKTSKVAVKSDYEHDLRFEFDGMNDLENQLKTEVENVLNFLTLQVN